MTSSAVVEKPAPTVGDQRPRRLNVPADIVDDSQGVDACDLLARVGIEFDPWQEFSLRTALCTRGDNRWAAFEVCILVPRQNGKGAIIEGRELFGLFLADEELIVHTAHEFKTSDDAFRRMRDIVDGDPWLRRRVRKMPESHGEEGVYLYATPTLIFGSDGRQVRKSRSPTLRYFARTGKSGRGLSSDCTILDEGFNLPDSVMTALIPTMSARRNLTVGGPQLWYLSSAVNQEEHNYGVTLARVRARGLTGTAPRLAFMEWIADEQRYLDLLARNNTRLLKRFVAEPEQALSANPAIGYRLDMEHTETERGTMSLKGFVVERLNIGDWPSVDDDTVVDMTRWDAIADPESRPGPVIALAVDVAKDGSWAAIASAGRRADGRLHVKVVDHRAGTHWVAARVADLCAAYSVCAVVIDPSSEAGALIEPLHEAGVRDFNRRMPRYGGIVTVTARELAQACGAFVNDIEPEADMLRHCGQDNLDDALRDAATRPLADAWAWSRKDSGGDITPLVAVTLAARGFRVHGRKGAAPWAVRG